MASQIDFLEFKGSRAKDLMNDPNLQGLIYPFAGAERKHNDKMLWGLIKRSPEVTSIFTAIIEDILSDGYYLEGAKDAKEKAKNFLERSQSSQQFYSFLYDALGLGNGYLYKLQLSKMDVKSAISGIINRLPEQIETKGFENELFLKAWGDTALQTKKFKSLPASTMEIRFNFVGGEITKYVQKVGEREVNFTPEEVVHFPLMTLDGKKYGWTPLNSIRNEMGILEDIKDYAGYFFSAGAVPNFLFTMPDETPNSENYKRMKSVLNHFTNARMKWKSLLLTGNVTAQELNRLNKDMEFKELAAYITQVIVMAWGVPATRLSDLLVNKGIQGASASSLEGYYRKISHYQDRLEELINSELLNDFKVKLRFNRSYKQDEVREVQIKTQQADACQKLLSLGLVTPEWCWDYMKIPEELRGDGKQEPEPGGLPTRQNLLNNHQIMSESTDKLNSDKMRQQTALSKKSKVKVEEGQHGITTYN